MTNYNIYNKKCQEEIKSNFVPKKKLSSLLADSFERISDSVPVASVLCTSKYSDSVRNCGSFLTFGRTASDEFKLHDANFCRVRLCPTCSWRRSLKVFSQVSRIMDVIQDDYVFLFLTLTVRNVSASELASKIDDMQRAWKDSFIKNVKFKKSVKGYFRALEVTHDTDLYITPKMFKKKKAYYKKYGKSVGDINDNYDMYHPHFHVILAVKKSYLTDKRSYITRNEWLEMWQAAIKDSSITQVDIRVCKSNDLSASDPRFQQFKNLGSAVAEVAKYSVKSTDYIVEGDEVLTDHSVETMFHALRGRRLCGLGGCFRDAWKQVKRSDESDIGDGDLIDINGELRSDVFVQLYKYEWTCGVYKLTEVIDDLTN